MTNVNLFGVLFIGGGLVLLAVFLIVTRRGAKMPLRPLDGYDTLPEQVGRVVESGGRVHVSLGPNTLNGQDAGVTLAGLAMLRLTASRAAVGDKPPLATTADPATLWVMSDTVRRAYEAQDRSMKLEAQRTQLVALDSTALAGGLTSLMPDTDVQASVLFSSFGPEVALIAEAGQRAGIPQTIGSDRLEAQAVGYTMADHLLIGEEIFAAPAYIGEEAPARAGLAAEDVLRWAVIVFILFGAALQTLGLLN